MQPLSDDSPVGNNSVAALGYLKLVRSPETLELLSDPNAFTLLAFIAFRARWRAGLGVNDVQLGEALIGDFRSLGMTRGEHREATKRLHKYHLATFRTTNRGTYARLANTKVFDINGASRPEPDNQPRAEQAASEQHANGTQTPTKQPLTKKESRESGKEGKQETLSSKEIGGQVEAIYQAYPRKEHTIEGKKAIHAALKVAPFEHLLERTRLYAQSRIGNPKHPQFTPLPATFFNKRIYDDDPTAWTSGNGSGANGSRNGQFKEDFTSRLRPMELSGNRRTGGCL